MADAFHLTIHEGIPADWPGVHDLGAARAHVFQTREFMGVWAETFGAAPSIAPRFVDVRDGEGALVLRLPLAIETVGGLRVLGFADQSCADYNAPILYPTTVVWTAERAAALWAQIETALGPLDKVVLDKMPAAVGDCVNPLYLIAGEANPESCHGSNLTLTWQKVMETQAQLKTLKRKMRAVEKLGEVRFLVARTAAERQRLLAVLLAQKQRRFEDTRVPGFAENPLPRAFFERATEVFGAAGDLYLAGLEVNGELVATSWGVALGATIYELMIGFESGDWAKHSPGRILNVRYLEWAKAEGFTYVDHGIGDESWKHENCDTHVPLGRLVAVRSAKAQRAAARDALVARLRGTALYARLRPYKWIVKRAIEKRLKRAA